MATHALRLALTLVPLLCLGAAPVTAPPPAQPAMDKTAQLAARTAEALNCLGYLALGLPGLEEVRARQGDAALSADVAEYAGLALRLAESKDWTPPDAPRTRAALRQLHALAPSVKWGEPASVAEATRLAREALSGLGLWPPEGEAPTQQREGREAPSGGGAGPTR